MSRVFVDGASGTVGLALQPYLERMVEEGAIEDVLELPEIHRRNAFKRQAAMSMADVVVLCLPDDVALEAAQLARKVNPHVRILDASAAHRCHPEWVYGLPEVTPVHAIQRARYVANPGCFATACILGAWPLRQALAIEQLDDRWVAPEEGPRLAFQGITGFSAGGRKPDDMPQGLPRLTQFGLPHRHLPEIAKYAGVTPTLTTMVGDWYQGMLVQVAVPFRDAAVLDVYREAYQGHPEIVVADAKDLGHKVDPQHCNQSNQVLIAVAGQPNGGTVIAVVLDNLGKGSAGAAAQNLRLMLGDAQ